MIATGLGIASIGLGFACVVFSYLSVMRKQSRWQAIVLGLCALLFITVIPVSLAVFVAAPGGSGGAS